MPTPVPTAVMSLQQASAEILYTAREQAILVALFVVFTLIVFAFNMKAQASTQKMIKEFREFTKSRDESWQAFIQKLSDQQAGMIGLLSAQFDARNNMLAEALHSVKEGLEDLQQFIATSLREMGEKRGSAEKAPSKPRKEGRDV